MRTLLLILSLPVFSAAVSQDFSMYEKHWFSSADGRLPYRLLYPLSFDSARQYPVIVFLHGAGSRGSDNEAQLSIGGRYFLREENRNNYPAIVIFPQCPVSSVWADFSNETDPASGKAINWQFPFHKDPGFPMNVLLQLLDSIRTLSFVNSNRMYIGGLSQGGMGVFDAVARRPDLFAAAFPICGAGKVSTARRFAGKVAMWIFHGEKDDVVPVQFSRDFFKALQKAKSDIRYTEYPGVFHNSWVNALSGPGLLEWLFSKEKQ